MNNRIQELALQAGLYDEKTPDEVPGFTASFEKFAQLLVKECAHELRDAEREADRAFKSGEVKERNTFNGYDFADILEERFGVE